MKPILPLLLSLCGWSAIAQDIDLPVEETVFKDSLVDVKPEFPGGIDAFYRDFHRQFKQPEVKGLVDKVMLAFVVEKDGSLTEIRIVHDAGFGTGDQAVTILEQGPRWKPGSKDGKPVRTLHWLPIAILTEE